MNRLLVGAGALLLSALPAFGPTTVAAPDTRSLPMRFELRQEGPRDACAQNCRTWVSATGAITAETPRDFDDFARTQNLNGATIALDSDGGSVLGALALGRSVRKLGMITTVGKSIDAPSDGGEKRSQLLPRAYCESMCAFVLLAGVQRYLPSEARVLVHQIWLGDRRDDPTAANYSAEDLVLVQRDIGRLAQYTVEMGGAIDLLEIALKIPPWEPMRLLSRDELRGMNIVTTDDALETGAVATAASAYALANGARAGLPERSWIAAEKAGQFMLTRKHPLTVEGDEIGTFELSFGCGEAGKDYTVTYVEQRRSSGDTAPAPDAPTDVEISLSGKSVPLKIVSSDAKLAERTSIANGRIAADLFKTFADTRHRSLMVETANDDTSTAIRIGNAGVSRSFAQLASSCGGSNTVVKTDTTRNEPLRREAGVQPR
ncbi:MAG: hypothetical protein AB1490_18765 [Pseudomonadota bacterium]